MTFYVNESDINSAVSSACQRSANTSDIDWKLTIYQGIANVRLVVFVLYLVTFLFGFIGNTLTVLVILSERKLKSAATCFILNLAVADDLFMLSLPFMAHR